MKPKFRHFLPLVIAFSLPQQLPAATLYWDGTDSTADADGGSGTWDATTANWDDAATGGTAATWPAASTGNDDAVFGGAGGTVTVDAGGITVNGITVLADGYTVSGGNLALDGSASTPEIVGDVGLTVSSNLTGSGGLTKLGNGRLDLTGDNSGLAGTLTIAGATSGNNGGISATGANAVAGFTSIDIQNNSFLQLQGISIGGTVAVSVAGNGGASAPEGAIRGAGGTNVVNAPVSLLSGIRLGNVGGSSSITFNGAVTAPPASGYGILVRRGINGGVIFTNSGNYWEGTTQVNESVYFHPGALPDETNLQLAAILNGWFETNGTFERTPGSAAGEVSFTATAGRINGFSARGGDLTVNLGGSEIPDTLVWGTSGFVPGVLGLAGANSTGTLDWTNPLDLNGAARTIDAQNGSADVDAIITAAISGASGSSLTKTGRGVIELATANSHPGGTVIAQSQSIPNPLRVSHSNALGTGSLTIGGGGNGDQSQLELIGGVTISNAVATMTSRNNFVASIVNLTGNNAMSANLASGGGGARITIQSDDGELTLSGSLGVRNPNFIANGDIVVSGNITSPATYRTLTKSGAGTLTLTGASNVTETSVTITEGILQIGNGGATGTPGTAPIVNDGTLTFNRDGELTVAGAISGAGELTNAGPGIVTLAGALSHSGATTIGNGTLVITGDASSASGLVSVGDGTGDPASAILGGTGPIGGNVVLDSDGAIAPGLSAGTLTTLGGISGSGKLLVEIDGAQADKLVVGGTLDITTMSLDVSGLSAPTEPVYVIVDSASAITGAAFAAVTGVPSGYTLTYNYNDGVDSNNIALVATGGTPFTTWATTTNGLAGGDAAPGADPDNDGLDNAIEFVIGGQPNPANPNANSTGLAPTVTTDASNLVFTFRRTDLALTQPGIVIIAEYGSNLSGWTTAVDGVNGISITETPDGFGAGVDRVDVTIPKTLATGSKLFCRLNVVIP